MAGRFVIDINVGGQSHRGDAGSALIGAAATRSIQGARPNRFANPDTFERPDKMTPSTIKQTEQELGISYLGSRLKRLGTMRRLDWDSPDEGPGSTYQETEFGYQTRMLRYKAEESFHRNKKAIKGLGIAAIYKGMNSVMEMQSYTSGDQVANARMQSTAKYSGYMSAIAISGLNPALIVGIVGNETFNAINQGFKFNYDRKMERAQITNSEVVLGDISYGRRRGGR